MRKNNITITLEKRKQKELTVFQIRAVLFFFLVIKPFFFSIVSSHVLFLMFCELMVSSLCIFLTFKRFFYHILKLNQTKRHIVIQRQKENDQIKTRNKRCGFTKLLVKKCIFIEYFLLAPFLSFLFQKFQFQIKTLFYSHLNHLI